MKIQTKRLSKNTYLTILSVILVLVTMIGTSYGFLMKTNEAETSYTTGILQIELITTGDGYGEAINLLNAVPMTNEEAQDITPYKFIIKNTGNLNYQFDLKLVLDEEKMTEDGCANNTLSFSNVKVQVNDETPVLLSDLTDSVLISNSVLNAGKSMEVSIRIWLDENTTNAAIGKHFHAILATEGYAIETPVSNTGATMLASLYTDSTKTNVLDNNITYEYSADVYMMKDIDDNIRYYGTAPNNYIYFNCETYPDTNCEKWRIIGVFEGKVKIMRNESIGEYIWDTSALIENGVAVNVNSGNGINQWGESTYTDGSTYEGADLMRLLNPGYDSNSVNNSLYYNAKSGNCYNDYNNQYTSCDFRSTGLKNDETRNLISDSLYYLGALNISDISSFYQIYEFERGELNYGSSLDNVNRTTEWTGKIGLPYLSDYYYAMDLQTFTSWMDLMLETTCGLLITPGYSEPVYVYGFSSSSGAGIVSSTSACAVMPTLYLESNIVIDSEVGTGDVDDPYRIIIS